MNKIIIIGSVVLAVIIVGLAIGGYFDSGITGNLSSSNSTLDMTKSIQIGIVLLASLGIFAITLVNLFHKD